MDWINLTGAEPAPLGRACVVSRSLCLRESVAREVASVRATLCATSGPTPWRPGNAGGGKGPYFWCACEGGKER